MRKTLLALVAAVMLAMTSMGYAASDATVRIAFMPDVHFHDVYGDLSDTSFAGVPNPKNGKSAFIRTMYAQLTSTRLFNETYFIFFAALDDAVSRGIKTIVLAGDFTDDGQPVHTIAFKNVLDEYAKKFGLVFLTTNGNHDPYRPYGRPSGKKDFLGADGREQRVFSRSGTKECVDYEGDSAVVDTGKGLPTQCTEIIRELGYAEIGDIMAAYGFKPNKSFKYWETPYSTYDYDSYNFEQALIESRWENRTYEICLQGAGGEYKQPGYTACVPVPDSSYLVELPEDVWLLVADSNIYRILEKAELHYPTYPGLFDGSSYAGWNSMKQFKPHIVEWVASVVERAKQNNKRLVAVSHFPMTEYYGGIGADIVSLFGKGKLQTGRLPDDKTMQMLADTGVRVHVGGHMHVNSTNSVRSGDNFLVNIQSPAMSSYVSGYKIMTLHGADKIEIETVQLNDVPRFDELFDLYRLEHKHLSDTNSKNLWDAGILEAKTFREYTDIYFRELTRLRFIPREWPVDMRSFLVNAKGSDLLIASQLPADVTFGAFAKAANSPMAKASTALADCLPEGSAASGAADLAAQWKQASDKAAALLAADNLKLADLDWDGFELIVDFHRIINAGGLALPDIPAERLAQYKVIAKALAVQSGDIVTVPAGGKEVAADASFANWTKTRFGAFMNIIMKKLSVEPDDHFMIDYANKTITRLD